MIQTQTKWKLGALLLVAPLLMPAVAGAKDYEQTDDTAASIISSLKQGYKWTSAAGALYLFRQDGQFEYRPAADDPYHFSRDFGRFTARRATADDEPYLQGEKWILELKITSSVRKPRKKGEKSKIVQRVGYSPRPLRMFSNRPNNDDRYDPNLYFLIVGERFNQPNPYAK